MISLEDKINTEKTKLIFSTGYLASGILVVMAPMYLYIFKNNLSAVQTYNILLSLVLPAFFRLIISYFFSKNLNQENEIDQTWERLYFWTTSVIGLAWGVSFYYLFSRVSDIDRIFILMTAAGIISAGPSFMLQKLKCH